MKKLIFTGFILILFSLIISCNDIVDSDDNILVTKLNYKNVKVDQTNDVLMPLSANKTWYYIVEEYDENSSIINSYIDSIVVKSAYVIDNEQWFDIYMPYISTNTLLLTNTDIGLWIKCNGCENESFLLAKYPDYSEEFASDYLQIEGIENAVGAEYQNLDEVIIKKVGSEQMITVPLGKFDCIKYNGTFLSDELNNRNYMTEFYKPDLGLVKADIYDITTQKISKSYSLLDTADIQFDNQCSYHTEVILDKNILDQGFSKNVNLVNTESGMITITEVIIETESIPGTMNLNAPMSSSLPVVLAPNESINLEVQFQPVSQSRFTGVMKVMANNGCWYEILFM